MKCFVLILRCAFFGFWVGEMLRVHFEFGLLFIQKEASRVVVSLYCCLPQRGQKMATEGKGEGKPIHRHIE